MGADDAAVAAVRARWAAVPQAPWHWDDQPEGQIRVWFSDSSTSGWSEDNVTPPEGYEPSVACAILPGDMETYESPDLRIADALAAAPADVALLLARLDALAPLAAAAARYGIAKAAFQAVNRRYKDPSITDGEYWSMVGQARDEANAAQSALLALAAGDGAGDGR